MAHFYVNKVDFALLFLCFSCPCVYLQTYNIDKKTVEDCKAQLDDAEQAGRFYFDISQLNCQECAPASRVSEDGLRCVCESGYKLTRDNGGGEITCEACGTDQVTSSDGWDCIECGAGSDYDDQTRTCSTCTVTNPYIIVERNFDGTYTGNPSRTCTTCSAETIPSPEGDRCERCSLTLSIPGQSTCVCPSDRSVGGVCFESENDFDPNGAALIYDVVYSENEVVQSEWLRDQMQAAYGLCQDGYRNMTACQVLASMCALNLYDRQYADSSGNRDACSLYLDIYDSSYMPQIYVDDTDDALTDTGISTRFTFPDMKLKLMAASYSYNGTFLGVQSLTNGLFQFCKNTEDYLNAAFQFGTSYKQSCTVSAKELFDQETILYDVFLEYEDSNEKRLYRVPIRVLNYVRDDTEVNKDSDRSVWELFYRMYLVDNELGRPWIDPSDPSASVRPERAVRMRYAQSITVEVRLQDDADGKIYPPLITVNYAEIDSSDYEDGEVWVSFNVQYTMDITSFNNDMGIAAGVLCGLAVLYAGVQAWGWSKRQGQASIDCLTLIKFLTFCCANIANCFFIVAFGGAMYYWIFFKNQKTVVLMLPSSDQEAIIVAFISVALILKFLDVVNLIVKQVTTDIFFIDWERPRGKIVASHDAQQTGEESPVSIWRTYFAANEYNEIQSCRKFNHIFQKFVVVLFLSVIGFENIATRDPNSDFTVSEDDYTPEHSRTLRFAISTLAYLLISLCQWMFHVFIYERFIEDPVRQYVDFCSMSNISVVIFENAVFGYYIHGRSVHGRADTGMSEMAENLKREEEDLCGQRGLLPNTEQQTFQFLVPNKLRARYDQVLLPILNPSAGGAANMAKTKEAGQLDGQTAKCIQGYHIVNRFFQGFIDHSLKNLDYFVKDKMLFESILGVEFEAVDSNKGFFYNDNGHSFDNVLFYGNEMTLTIFDILVFVVVDMLAQNVVLAAIITYFVDVILIAIRDGLGRRNLAKKTLVDKRFLI